MTVDLPTARASISARKRREFHERRLAAAAAAGRDRLWAAAAWIVSEAAQLPRHEREEIVVKLRAIAHDLNGRYEP